MQKPIEWVKMPLTLEPSLVALIIKEGWQAYGLYWYAVMRICYKHGQMKRDELERELAVFHSDSRGILGKLLESGVFTENDGLIDNDFTANAIQDVELYRERERSKKQKGNDNNEPKKASSPKNPILNSPDLKRIVIPDTPSQIKKAESKDDNEDYDPMDVANYSPGE